MVLFVGIAVHGLILVGCYLLFIKFVCAGSIVVEGSVLSLVLTFFSLMVTFLNYKEVKFFFRNSLIKKERFIRFLSGAPFIEDQLLCLISIAVIGSVSYFFIINRSHFKKKCYLNGLIPLIVWTPLREMLS
jgi:hypothetical protein